MDVEALGVERRQFALGLVRPTLAKNSFGQEDRTARRAHLGPSVAVGGFRLRPALSIAMAICDLSVKTLGSSWLPSFDRQLLPENPN